jgi:ubiquinone/menaquinone biosynthesis C-methylase UbiE
MSLKRKIDQKFYPQYENNWDDKLFRKFIIDEISDDSIILDLGAGAGIVEEMNFKGFGKKICGVDLDDRVVDNPFLDEGKVADASGIPYPDNYFDIVFSDNVLEHLDKPIEVFNEVNRVLKPG